MLALGTDPSQQKRIERITKANTSANTFDVIARELIAKKTREGRAAATLSKTEWLLSFASPVIGNRPIADITAAEVLDALRKVEKRGRLESARRLRSVIGEVFRYTGREHRGCMDEAGDGMAAKHIGNGCDLRDVTGFKYHAIRQALRGVDVDHHDTLASCGQKLGRQAPDDASAGDQNAHALPFTAAPSSRTR